MDPTKLPLLSLAEHLSPVCFLPPKSTWVTLSHHTPWYSWGHGVPVPSVSEAFLSIISRWNKTSIKRNWHRCLPSTLFWIVGYEVPYEGTSSVINGVICAFVSPPMLDCFWFESFTHYVCKIMHILLSPK